MTYNINIRPKAKKDIKKLDNSIQYKIIKKLNELKKNPNIGKSLVGDFKNSKSLRVNKYCIIYLLKEKEKKVIIVRVEYRKNIYSIEKLNKNILKSPKSKFLTEKIIIVNQLDEIIGSKDRYSIIKDDIYRVSVLIIKNAKNEILLAQRSKNKKNNPGMWGPSVAGTNALGEDYIDNILREAEEEVNLIVADFELKLIEKLFVDEGKQKYFTSIFFVTIDDEDSKQLKIDKTEVEKIKWFSKSRLEQELKENKNKYLNIVNDFFKYYNM
jgi:mRNA-degrading endonuclease RelE of RelBE toxin-antitoxin system/isopentenyldiphosphate isomerase